jgi:predicted component of type VI protein secretion system
MGWGFRIRFHSMDAAAQGERVAHRLPVRIGRNALNDCQIVHPFVSDFHAVLELIDGKLCLRDLQSKNGVFGPTGERIAQHEPFEIARTNNMFVIGRFVNVQVEMFEQHQAVGARLSATQGSVIGNRAVLESGPRDAPGTPPPPAMPGSALSRGIASLPPLSFYGGSSPPIAPAFGPPPGPGAQGGPSGQPGHGAPDASVAQWGSARPNYGLSQGLPSLAPIGAGHAGAPLPGSPFPPAAYPGSLHGGAPPGPHRPGPSGAPAGPEGGFGRSTQHFAMTTESLALVGLRELAASLVPGVPLETTGDVARLLTKLHDTVEVFCRSFVPLREGYAQFMSSMDLHRAASQRSINRSTAALRVEGARDPATLAAALLDWRSQSYDAPDVVEAIFADLMIHHVAIVEGVMRGVQALLEELSPEAIERAFAEENRAAFLGHHRAVWKTYQRRYDEVTNETRTFELVFGAEFAASYREYSSRQTKPST